MMPVDPKPSPAQALALAADLLGEPGAWIQGELAKDRAGSTCEPQAPSACCWCMAGAVQRFLPPYRAFDRGYSEAAWVLREVLGQVEISRWNDQPGRTQSEAVAMLRRASALASERKL